MSLRRIRRKTFAALVIMLALGVVGSCLYVRKLQERKEIRSEALLGYRCRFTLPSDWQVMPMRSAMSERKPQAYFFATKPSPIREWISRFLFRQTPSTQGMRTWPALNLETYTKKGMAGVIKIQAGYPEPDWRGLHQGRFVTAQHLRIDDCPATMGVYELPSPTITYRGTILLVSTPDYATTYAVFGLTEPRHSDQADREMHAVLASFHIEKVVKP